MAVGYSGSFSQAANRAKEAGNGVVVDMRLPKEGAPVWFDVLAIPKDAKNPDDAHALINYLLQPQVIAPISDFVGQPGNPQQPQSLPLHRRPRVPLRVSATAVQCRTRSHPCMDQAQVGNLTVIALHQ